MSIPIRYCTLLQASEDAKVFAKVKARMRDNLLGGHFTILPCDHIPRCRAMTRGEMQQLFDRFKTEEDKT